VTRRPKLGLVLGGALLVFPLAACDGGSVEPDGNDGSATPTAPPTDDDNTGEEDSEEEGEEGGEDNDSGQGPDGSGG
jgi:hypothetical protein